jgi:O-acetyl-ADP-ribose deacetylase (regulator of RNase III)
MDFEVLQGDITRQRADALVNAANTALQMGGGVAGALREAAGEGIQAECDEKSPVDLGGAAPTDGYDLPADYVIHAATMRPGASATEASIRESTQNALSTADDLECRSVVLPALGCGIAGFDLETGSRYIFEEILDYDPEHLTDVRVVGYDGDSYHTMQRAADEVRREQA